MEVRELSVPDAYEVTPVQHGDDRGVFLEWFKDDVFAEDVGPPARPQAGQHLGERTRHASVASISPTCRPARPSTSPASRVRCSTSSSTSGSARRRSASGTRSCSTTSDRRAVYVAEGLGHVFMALTDGAVISYLCSEGYAPAREHGVHPLDPAIGIDWPADIAPLLSPKDEAAPTLAQAQAAGLLPSYDECQAFYRSLRP